MTVDPTIAGCLHQIRIGNVTAVGVLADYLEEQKLTGAKSVRKYWTKYTEVCEWHLTADFSRRKNTKSESIRKWRRWLRNRIRNLYGRKWKPLPLEKYR